MKIREYWKAGRPLLFDGAMGTYYASRPSRAEARCEPANLDRPEEISAIHWSYLEAGCRAIRTNTFDVGADSETARRIMEAGCRIALDAARPFGAYVFADLGPAAREGALSPGCQSQFEIARKRQRAKTIWASEKYRPNCFGLFLIIRTEYNII